ncbi:DUF4274 domain-containing protein [Paenibacillus elgii]
MLLFEAIKNRSMEALEAAALADDVNGQDKSGRTPLHYVITQKAPMEMFTFLLTKGADPQLEDKLGLTVLEKAIKFGNKQAVELLLAHGIELDHPEGIAHTPWFKARHHPEIADLLLGTKGAVRLTLTEAEREIVDTLLYTETEERMARLHLLNTPELLHAYVLDYNWDDDLEPIEAILRHPECQEATAYEVCDLADGDYWLEHEGEDDDERQYIALIRTMLKRFPQIENYLEEKAEA